MFKITFEDGTVFNTSKIIGVGLNYNDHISEMKNIKPSEPVLFLKPSTALCDFNKPIVIPKDMGSVHYELELAVCIGQKCSNVNKENATDYIAGFGLALDLTLRDVQSSAKGKGLPWSVAKGFDNSCPVTSFSKSSLGHVDDNLLSLKLNGSIKQSAKTSLMLFKVDELISYISKIFTLLPGDIILTGTPSGVGPLTSGDKIEASINGLVGAETTVI